MCRHPHPNGVQAAGHKVWNLIRLRQYEGQGTWPKCIDERFCSRRHFTHQLCELLAFMYMNNERVESRALLGLEDLQNGCGVRA